MHLKKVKGAFLIHILSNLTFSLLQYFETLLCLAVCWKRQVRQLSLYCNPVPVSAVAQRKTYKLWGVFASLGASSCHWSPYKLLCHRAGSLEVRSFAQDDNYSREGTSCQNTYKQHLSRHNSVICCWSFPIRKRCTKLNKCVKNNFVKQFNLFLSI